MCLSSSVRVQATEPGRNDCSRRLLSGFSHRCRNSLNGIKMSLYLFRRGARGEVPTCWGEIERSYQQLESLFDNLQLIYRPMTVTAVRCSLGQVIGDQQAKWRSYFNAKGRTLELVPPEREVVGEFDPIQIGMGLDSLARWRAEAGEARWHTRITWGARDDAFEICWVEFPADVEFPLDLVATSKEDRGDLSNEAASGFSRGAGIGSNPGRPRRPTGADR